jgi:hypothetical protein
MRLYHRPAWARDDLPTNNNVSKRGARFPAAAGKTGWIGRK